MKCSNFDHCSKTITLDTEKLLTTIQIETGGDDIMYWCSEFCYIESTLGIQLEGQNMKTQQMIQDFLSYMKTVRQFWYKGDWS